jgi:hypothetical protein
MNALVSATASIGTTENGHDLLYLAVVGICLLTALHYLRQMAVPVGPLVRVVAAAAMVALSIGVALVLLVTIAIGGR